MIREYCVQLGASAMKLAFLKNGSPRLPRYPPLPGARVHRNQPLTMVDIITGEFTPWLGSIANG